MEADVIVVRSLLADRIGKEILWGAMLRGAYLIMPTFVTGKSSAALKYQPAVQFWRRVFVSRDFRIHQPRLLKVVKDVCADARSKWQLIKQAPALNAAFAKAKKSNKGSQVVVLKATDAPVHGLAHGVKIHDIESFQKSITKVDATLTNT